MNWRSILLAGVAGTLIVGACSSNDPTEPSPPSSTTIVGSTTLAPTTAPSPDGAPSSTDVAAPACVDSEALAVVDAAVEQARLVPGGDWSTELDDNTSFADRTASGDDFAQRLGLDCGLTAVQTVGDDDRLVLVAWTGPRLAFVVQSSDSPSSPYRTDATVDVLIDAPRGEFVDGDERSVWAGTTASGETFVVGHVDYQLAPAAKGWQAGASVLGDEVVTLDAERHAIAALEEAGMRNVGIADLHEDGSEEGYVQFISPTGQILAVDVAPEGWFDPAEPRFFSGPTRFETIGGIEVRITEPAQDDNLGFTRGAEFGWACTGFVWILEPPFNGDADEMSESVAAIVMTEECLG